MLRYRLFFSLLNTYQAIITLSNINTAPNKKETPGKMNRCIFCCKILKQVIHNRRADDGGKAHQAG